jgi:hypothetical protein
MGETKDETGSVLTGAGKIIIYLMDPRLMASPTHGRQCKKADMI